MRDRNFFAKGLSINKLDVLGFDRIRHFTVDDDFDFRNRFLVFDASLNAAAVSGGLQFRERLPRWFAVECGEQHRPGGDETAAGVEALHPFVVAETARKMDVDTAEPERHGMHARTGSGGRLQSKTAIQQRVVGLKSVVDPAPFRVPVGVRFQVHVGRFHLQSPLTQLKRAVSH